MKTSNNHPMARVLSLRDFRLLFAGAAASLLGDQFTLIATPWLVLRLTSDPAALGLALALQGLPRAVFLLFGGALTDRISPRRMMLAANLVRMSLTAVMAFLVLTGAAQMWMVYIFSLVFGVAAGFAIPAENSIVPLLVGGDDLQSGNAIIMGTTQIAGFVGPSLAGIMIGSFAGSLDGVGLAYAIDAATFAASAVTLQLIRGGKARQTSTADAGKENILASITAGFRFAWGNRPLRFMFAVLLSINFLLVGPLLVGIPVLANSRLPEGAAAFGLLMSAFAGGNLAGYLVAGALPKPRGGAMRLILTLVVFAYGAVVGLLGLLTSTWLDFALLLLLGLGNGYIAITMMTWMQMRTPQDMLGRMMSLMMLASYGLVPISQALAGLASKASLAAMFAVPGAVVVCISGWMLFNPELKELCRGMVGVPVGIE